MAMTELATLLNVGDEMERKRKSISLSSKEDWV